MYDNQQQPPSGQPPQQPPGPPPGMPPGQQPYQQPQPSKSGVPFWVWLNASVLVLLLAGGGAYFYLSQDSDDKDSDGESSAEGFDADNPPDGLTDFTAPYQGMWEIQDLIENEELEAEELDHPWVVQLDHLDKDELSVDLEELEEDTELDLGDTDSSEADFDGYATSPATGGPHLSVWQSCDGKVYDAPVHEGNAVHSLEHGAVWITYHPDELPQSDIDTLAELVGGGDYLFMSPYPELDSPVSLQSWGVQMKLDELDTGMVESYLDAYRQNPDYTPEPGAVCSRGNKTTV
ncbi:DUF3105 domain-containing protein [Haloglycomyces albus]|uniref:DUF3105 domain-containing protein n=1 Tax=Haloglycomyces albus TaxID=526067 RepID=UPI00046D3791|nr:DUF3105 domain-containing protein [Haloglycomyces albus]